MRGIPLSAYSDDPRLSQPTPGLDSDILARELEALKASGAFAGSSAGDDALSGLRGLEGSLASIQAANAAARGGMNDSRPMPEPDTSPMPNLVRYEDYRPEADPSTLDSRAQDAAERLVSNSDSGLEMGMRGEVIGKGGTPVDKNKQLLAHLARETEMGRRQGLLAQNKKMKQGWRPMPQGMDPALAMMGKDAIPLLAERERTKAMADQNSMNLNVMGMQHKERMAGLTADPGGQRAAMAEKARVEAEAMRGAMGPLGQIGRLPPEVLQANPQLVQMIGDAARRAAQGTGAPMGGLPSLPPVADVNAAIEKVFQAASAAGREPTIEDFAAAGVSPDALRQYEAENTFGAGDFAMGGFGKKGRDIMLSYVDNAAAERERKRNDRLRITKGALSKQKR